MPRFSSYPLTTELKADDTLLLHQQATGLEKQITGSDIAASLIPLVSPGSELTISGLRLVDVTSLTTGDHEVVGGYYALGDGGGGEFYYNSTATDTDNGGTIIAPDVGNGRWFRPTSKTFNVKQFGAKADGTNDDTAKIQSAVNAAVLLGSGTVYFPAGNYKLTSAITLANTPPCNIAFTGDGANTSIITQSQSGSNGFDLNFANVGVQQPFRCSFTKLGLASTTDANIAIKISYGNPGATSSHLNGGALIDGCAIKSTDSTHFWHSGIDITSGWNNIITNTTISGNDAGGVWTNLEGAGIALRRSCVNTHISDCQINFFFTGLYFTAVGGTAGDPNTESIFCSNNSMVAVRRGVWIQGNPSATSPWMTGFQWIGGLVELRGGIHGINLEACSQARIANTYVIDGAIGAGANGVLLSTCQEVVVTGNQFYAMDFGVVTNSTCSFIEVSNNIFRGGGTQVTFAAGTTESRSHGNIVNGAPRQEVNNAPAIGSQSRIYQGQAYGFFAKKDSNQSIPDSTDTSVTWQTVVYDDLDYNLPGAFRFFNPATPSRIYVPPGVTRVRVTAGIRWDSSAVGTRTVKIRTPVAGSYYPANTNWASDARSATTFSDCTLSTALVELDPNNGNYFDVVVSQTSGGALNVRNVEGTYVQMEIIG